MSKTIIGIVIASVVLYIWGFVYWGMGPYSTMIWRQAADDAAVGQALLDHFPENGTYFIPGHNEDAAAAEALFDKGPVAFVHMISNSGRPMMDPKIMIGGFFLNVVVIVLIAVLMNQVSSALPTYAFYDLSFWVIAGLILAKFVGSANQSAQHSAE